ncbi:MAG: redoxin family protein [Clostridia bacterium]|nr:redoxin family protein [Clostridia bacterium]
MKNRKQRGRLSGAEVALLAAAIILALLIGFGLFRLTGLLRADREEATASPLPSATPAPQTLAAPEDWLPQNLYTGSAPPEAVFQDEDAAEIPLSALQRAEDRGLWLVFWASWCPDCDRQFRIIQEMEALAERYAVRLVLVDRLNPEKESVGAARQKIADVGAVSPVVYDRNETVYKAWGLREIPSAVVLDRNGRVAAFDSGDMTAGACEGMLKNALEGPDQAGLAFIRARLSDGQGGVGTSTAAGGESPSGADVLSESEGLLLQYALAMDNQPLFDETMRCVRERLTVDGLLAWYCSAEGPAAVNATLDDLRVWDALHAASARWPGDYAAWADEMADAICSRCVNTSGGLVDWVELTGGGRAETISLSYLDLNVLRALAGVRPDFQPAVDKAEELLRNGRISDSFPLYYSGYSYPGGAYSQADLNMAEALVTLWNLSRAGALPADAWDWLRARIMAGDLPARCHVDGTAVSGYTYHATAVWGLAALISREQGDAAAFEKALRRMNRLCVTDTSDAMYGAYAQRGASAYAFDQLIPLLVNAGLSAGRAE